MAPMIPLHTLADVTHQYNIMPTKDLVYSKIRGSFKYHPYKNNAVQQWFTKEVIKKQKNKQLQCTHIQEKVTTLFQVTGRV